MFCIQEIALQFLFYIYSSFICGTLKMALISIFYFISVLFFLSSILFCLFFELYLHSKIYAQETIAIPLYIIDRLKILTDSIFNPIFKCCKYIFS